MRTIALTAALIAATVSTAAIAADWVWVTESTNGNRGYVDRESIRTMPNGYKRAWVRTYLSKPDRDGDTGYRALNEYDCSERRMRGLQTTWFKDEVVTRTHNKPNEWLYVAPESTGETQLNYVCFGNLPE
jgi:hypothetical protein